MTDPDRPSPRQTAPGDRPSPPRYDREPDFTRPPLELSPEVRDRLLGRLRFLYGDEAGRRALDELVRLLRVHHAHKGDALRRTDAAADPSRRFTEHDVILITYGDLLRSDDPSPLAALGRFCDNYLHGTINTIHILPFFPYSSDRGFSVIDYESVDPRIGTWDDVERLGERYRLMFDAVVNHVSARSRWFREFRNGHPGYREFFTAFDSPDALTPEDRALIFRPRTSDVLTRTDTVDGPRWVWTTFSPDQVDLNYKNPGVLLRVVDVLLLYVRHGAEILRLDAVTYLWCEPGTRCIHLPQTHEIVKLLRDVLDVAAPGVALITETNVPHAENVSYFGDGRDEAQMVYNFALPPLVLHAFYREDATLLTRWAASLEAVSDTATFFNFLDSHDGIGLLGARGILPENELAYVVERARDHGALVSYKTGSDGRDEPYELNVTWFSALNGEDGDEDVAFQVRRFVATRVVALVLRGVPGIYLHSLVGTRNDLEAVLAAHSNRAINRAEIDEAKILDALADPLSKVSRISRELGRLIALRARQPAFHPTGTQQVLELSPQVFAVWRAAPGGGQLLLTLVNVSARPCELDIRVDELAPGVSMWHDLVSDMTWMTDEGVLAVSLAPYDPAWLEPRPDLTP